MTDEEIIRELKSVEEQYRNKPVPTFEINISLMARSCRQHIEQLAKENSELKEQIEQLSNDNHVLKTSFITQQEQIEKMKCCYNCKNCEIDFTNDSGIKYGCKKLRHKSADCILNDYHCWELAE